MIDNELFRARIGIFCKSPQGCKHENNHNRNPILLELLVNGTIKFTTRGIKVSTGTVSYTHLTLPTKA